MVITTSSVIRSTTPTKSDRPTASYISSRRRTFPDSTGREAASGSIR